MFSMQEWSFRSQCRPTEVFSWSLEEPQVKPHAVWKFPSVTVATLRTEEFIPLWTENSRLEAGLRSPKNLRINNLEIQKQKSRAVKSSTYLLWKKDRNKHEIQWNNRLHIEQ